MSNSHNSISALAIHCIDYRFVEKQRDFFLEKGLEGNYDLIAYPGASKEVETLSDAISVSIRLHNPSKILILDHEDCGAFGENNSFDDHKNSLEKAKKFLEEKFPNISVELYLSQLDGKVAQI